MKALNCSEIELILKEIPFENSRIQEVIQTSFHSLVLRLYNVQYGKSDVLISVGTPDSRIHLITKKTKINKMEKLERFEQFARKYLEGGIIREVFQTPKDRLIRLTVTKDGNTMLVFIRLYSGSSANIIVTDGDMKILDLMFRRPSRDEISGKILQIAENKNNAVFPVRDYKGYSFNAFIENEALLSQPQNTDEVYYKKINEFKAINLDALEKKVRSFEKTRENTKDFEKYKKYAQLLSAEIHNIHGNVKEACVFDWEENRQITICLNEKIKAKDNIALFYEKFEKERGAFNNAEEQIQKLEKEILETEEIFNSYLEITDEEERHVLLSKLGQQGSKHEDVKKIPGLQAVSGDFDILIGRNAKENLELLRYHAKGNDLWLHTRDFPGGYVFIKSKKNKTVPLETLIDAANLAVLFSKAKNNTNVNLFYTQVCNLKRVKNSKEGLIIPQNEKNLTINADNKRAKELIKKTLQ